jgi:hypothetical protein
VITAVDTNVLLDVFGADARFGASSAAAIRRCSSEGRLVASDVVVAELASVFPTSDHAAEALARLEVSFGPMEEPSALAAGVAWRSYRERGGRRERLVADFLIGAHALHQADRLLTRDRGFYRGYFTELEILDPSSPAP